MAVGHIRRTLQPGVTLGLWRAGRSQQAVSPTSSPRSSAHRRRPSYCADRIGEARLGDGWLCRQRLWRPHPAKWHWELLRRRSGDDVLLPGRHHRTTSQGRGHRFAGIRSGGSRPDPVHLVSITSKHSVKPASRTGLGFCSPAANYRQLGLFGFAPIRVGESAGFADALDVTEPEAIVGLSWSRRRVTSKAHPWG